LVGHPKRPANLKKLKTFRNGWTGVKDPLQKPKTGIREKSPSGSTKTLKTCEEFEVEDSN